MYRRRARSLFTAFLLLLCFAIAAAQGQEQSQAKKAPAKPDIGDESATNAVGCLEGSAHTHFTIADEYGNVYTLVGVSPELAQYVGDQVIVAGTKDDSTQPPSLHVTSFRHAMHAPAPRLEVAFVNTDDWAAETNKAYGLKYSYPAYLRASEDAQGHAASRLAEPSKTVDVAMFQIPEGAYEGTNFVGGWYRLSVNPQITSPASCKQFGESDAKDVSSRTVNGFRYATFSSTSAADGTSYTDYYLHSFQNGMCYEIAFTLGEFDTHNREMGCQIASLSQADEWNLMKPLLNGITFVRPQTGKPK